MRKLVALALAGAAFAVAGCGDQGHYTYPAATEQDFLSTCSLSTSQCKCALSWLEHNYSYDRVVALDDYATAHGLPQAAVDGLHDTCGI